MRIGRLDLTRYGHFTGVSLEFPDRVADLHIIFGPNEAGKSTVLNAVEDFLFGIPPNSPFNYVHEYSRMKVGALLEYEGQSLEAWRRKGTRDTLLNREDLPHASAERILASLLGGTNRAFLTRMFSLNHDRLRQGGRDMVDAKDEIGQMLFSAGTGLTGFRQHLERLESQADALWAPRRAGHRKYYQAEDRLRLADQTIKEHTVTAARWQELRDVFELARQTDERVEQEWQEKAARLRKIGRIRRVYRTIRTISDLEARLGESGPAPALKPDAREEFTRVQRLDARLAAMLESLEPQLQQAIQDRQGLVADEGLLQRSDDVDRLWKQRIEVAAGERDLPKRRAELALHEAHLRELATELEWEAEDLSLLIRCIPAKTKLADVRGLLGRYGQLVGAVQTAEQALAEAEVRCTECTQQLSDIGESVDLASLSAALESIRQEGDLTGRVSAYQIEFNKIHNRFSREWPTLKPMVPDLETLAGINVSLESVQAHREAQIDLQQRLRSCRDQLETIEEELRLAILARENIIQHDQVVAENVLLKSRAHRDHGWVLIRRKYLERAPIEEAELKEYLSSHADLPAAYETAVRETDSLADARFDRAEAVAQFRAMSRQIGERQEQRFTLKQKYESLEREQASLISQWAELWRSLPVPPLDPNGMAKWITVRASLLQLAEQRENAEIDLAACKEEEAQAVACLETELTSLGIDNPPSPDGSAFRSILQRAEALVRDESQRETLRRKLREHLRRAKAEVEQKRDLLTRAEEACQGWDSQFAAAAGAVGLSPTATPETSTLRIEIIEEMRTCAEKIHELSEQRIAKIERDTALFTKEVKQFVANVALDLNALPADEAVVQVKQRLDTSRRIVDRQKEQEDQINMLKELIQGHNDDRTENQQTLELLQALAGVSSIEVLSGAIDRAEAIRGVETELADLRLVLKTEGDGLTEAELEAECQSVNLDELAIQEEQLAQDIELLKQRLRECRGALDQARREFEAIGGDDTAARAAAEQAAAVAELTEIAEQYTRLKTSALLLRWAIERYRREKQAPLLHAASTVFSQLTVGAYHRLTLEFDDHDKPFLVGCHRNGSTVPVDRMSDGTADQLYLALRVASIGEYLEHATAMPFIADDLFINFDDERAASGLQALSQLAQKTQVLFFTHHQHLVDLARKVLGDTVPVTSLG